MPSSNVFMIPHIINRIQKLKPESVLDIGIGFGKYGFLMREYLDVCQTRYQSQEWQIKIDGIEIAPNYIGDLQRRIYSNIYIGEALDVLPGLGNYGLIILIATLEHLQKDKGRALLALIKERSKVALVSIPVKVLSINCPKPGKVFKNKYETHRCQWTQEELEQFGQVKILPPICGKIKDTFLLEINSEKRSE